MKSLVVKYANGHKSRYNKMTSLKNINAEQISDMLFSVFMSCVVMKSSKISGMGFSAEKTMPTILNLGVSISLSLMFGILQTVMMNFVIHGIMIG